MPEQPIISYSFRTGIFGRQVLQITEKDKLVVRPLGSGMPPLREDITRDATKEEAARFMRAVRRVEYAAPAIIKLLEADDA